MNARMTPEQARTALASMTDADFPTASPDDDVDDALVERLVEAAHKTTGRPSLTRPGQHSPQITLRLPGPTNDGLWRLAEHSGRRRSDIVREALDRYLADALPAA